MLKSPSITNFEVDDDMINFNRVENLSVNMFKFDVGGLLMQIISMFEPTDCTNI